MPEKVHILNLFLPNLIPIILPSLIARITRGAGDAYRGGFMAGFLRNFDLKTCGQKGSVVVAYTVEKYGTTTHHFTQKEFCDRYRKKFKQSLKL